MSGEPLVSPKYPSPSHLVSNRFYFVVAVTCIVTASTLLLALFVTGVFNPETEVEITTSILRTEVRVSTYSWVAVEVRLFNPGRSRRVTVWAEITDQPTQVSYSKAQSVHIAFRESQDVTIEFSLDRRIYSGAFTHRVWLSYPTQD